MIAALLASFWPVLFIFGAALAEVIITKISPSKGSPSAAGTRRTKGA